MPTLGTRLIGRIHGKLIRGVGEGGGRGGGDGKIENLGEPNKREFIIETSQI